MLDTISDERVRLSVAVDGLVETRPSRLMIRCSLLGRETACNIAHQRCSGIAVVNRCRVFNLGQRQAVVSKLLEVAFQHVNFQVQAVFGCHFFPSSFVRLTLLEIKVVESFLYSEFAFVVLNELARLLSRS